MRMLPFTAAAVVAAASLLQFPSDATAMQIRDRIGRAAPSDSALEAQVRAVAATLRCPVCQALSIQDSPSPLAEDMRDVIRERLRSGSTPEEVRAYFESRYGEWILLEPRAEGFNMAVWALPVALLLSGLAFVLWLARKWTRRPGEGVPPAEPGADGELARFREELERWEGRG